jgi:TonB-dependent receptor-like protein
VSGLLGDFICADGTTSSSGCSNPVMVGTTEGTTVPAQTGMVFDPSTGNPDGSGRKAFSSGGQVNVFTPAAPMPKLLTYLPMPNTGAPGQVFNNYIASPKEGFNSDQYDGRIDYNRSDKHHFFGRYSIADFTKHSPGAYGEGAGGPSVFGFAGRSQVRNQSVSLGYTYSLSPTLIADFRFGAYRYRVHVDPNGAGTNPASDAGLIGLNRGTFDTEGMPAFNVNGNGGFNFGYSLGVNQCNCPLRETENHFQWVNNWTKQAGNHTIKWGADIRRAQQRRIDSSTHRAGEVSFVDSTTGNADVDTIGAPSGATTGAALASYLLGVPGSFVQQFSGPGFYPSLRQTRLYFFGQDAWRATQKLTVTYGLRYENYLPQTGTKPGSAGTFDPLTGEVVVAGIGRTPRNMGIQAYNLGFAPRLGLAYQLRPTTVVRAGYGRSFNAAGVGAVFAQNPELDPPVQFVYNLNAPNPYGSAVPTFLTSGIPAPPAPPINLSTGRYPLPDGVSVYFYFDQPNAYRIPLADFWNFSIQNEIRTNLSLELAYVGNVGRHLFANENRNQAVPGPGDYDPRRPFFPNFGLEQGIYNVCNCDNSNYHSLQAKLEKKTSHGLDFLLTYTWSKAITDSEGGYSFDNNYNLRGDYGPASWDHTHALTLLHTWELPFGKGRRWAANGNKAVDALVGGWRFSGVTTMLSGAAFTPFVSNAPLLNSDFNSVRPDVIGNPGVSNPNANEWFNPSAYTAPQQHFRDGTASKGSLRGPAEYVFNLALAKNFFIAEGKTLEFRWENFNAFNIDNLGLPNNTVDVSGAGQITSTATAMRQMQFALHFRF